jgi:transcription elongation factor Elf1
MELLEENIECPYCGENLVVLIDQTEAGQSYIEDCQVCCRPINFSLIADLDGSINIRVRSDNE